MSSEVPDYIDADKDQDADLLGAARPGETDEDVRARHNLRLRRQEERRRAEWISPEDNERNRKMLERFSRGDFSDPEEP